MVEVVYSGQTNRRTDRQTGWFLYTPQTSFVGGIIIALFIEGGQNYGQTDRRMDGQTIQLFYAPDGPFKLGAWKEV